MTGAATAFLLLAASGLVALSGAASVAGWPAFEAAALLLYGAGALWLTCWAAERARPSWRDAAGALVMWAVFVASLTGLYLNRDAAMDGLRTLAEEIAVPPSPAATVTAEGEVTFTRRRGGMFTVAAEVNGRGQSFMFDTGASAVVLTPASARELGFRDGDLRFRVPVWTANGSMLAAPVTLDRLAIGPIVLTRVPALVAGPGLLRENLLGQSALDRLDSYEVRGNRLVLRAGRS